MKIGLLIVDCKKSFYKIKEKKLNVEGACEHINYVADLLRSKNHCVIHIQDIEGAEDLNSELLEIISEIKVEPVLRTLRWWGVVNTQNVIRNWRKNII